MTTSLHSPVPRIRRRLYRKSGYDVLDILFLPQAASCDVTLTEAFGNRYSCRAPGGLLSPVQLGALLDLAVRVRTSTSDEAEAAKSLNRPYPSAGGIYEIDVVVCGLLGHEDALFVYDPEHHALASLRGASSGLVEKIRRDVEKLVPGPATILWGVADVNALSAKYRHYESLLWRDSGCLWAGLSFAIAALGHVSCIVGIHEPKGLRAVLGRYPSMVGVGGMVVAPCAKRASALRRES